MALHKKIFSNSLFLNSFFLNSFFLNSVFSKTRFRSNILYTITVLFLGIDSFGKKAFASDFQEVILKCGAQGVVNGSIYQYLLIGSGDLKDEKMKFHDAPLISIFQNFENNKNSIEPIYENQKAALYNRYGCDIDHCVSHTFYNPDFGSDDLFYFDAEGENLVVRTYDKVLNRVIFLTGSCSL